MRTHEEITQLLTFAQEQGMPWIEVDGVKMPVPQPARENTDPEGKSPEINLDTCAGMSDEEILMWATPRYDELQAEKKAKEERLKEEAATRG